MRYLPMRPGHNSCDADAMRPSSSGPTLGAAVTGRPVQTVRVEARSAHFFSPHAPETRVGPRQCGLAEFDCHGGWHAPPSPQPAVFQVVAMRLRVRLPAKRTTSGGVSAKV